MTELDKKTKSLNQSGTFLQFHILNELNKRKWSTVVETPVSFAPFNKRPETHQLLYGQLLSKHTVNADHFAQAVLESQNQSMKNETSVDIDAGKNIELKKDTVNAIFRLYIEVKKNDPDYSDWCFFQQKIKSEPMRLTTKNITSKGRVNLFTVTENDRYKNKIWVQTIQYPSLEIFTKDVSDFALALHAKEVKKDYYRSEKTKVDEAARQIIKGTYGLIIDRVVNQVTTGKDYSHDPDIFVPIIITNANLFLCTFDPKDIDPNKGHIKKDPDYQPIDSIIYEYPKPKEVQFPDPLASNLAAEFRDHILKWHVLVMSPKGFVKFLEELDKIDSLN